MKDGSRLIKVLILTDAPVAVYKNNRVGNYLENKHICEWNFSNQNESKISEPFQMRKHANLEGSTLNEEQKEKVKELFIRHQQVCSRNSNALGYCDKMKHKIKLNEDTQPFRRNYCTRSFDKRKAIKKIVEDLEDAKLIEPTHSYWAEPSILVKKNHGSYRLVVDYRGLNKQIEKTSWSLPKTNNVFDSLHGNCYFSNIDLTSGYFQMALD